MQRLFKLIPILMVGLVTLLVPTISHAQLSCSNPPPPFDNPAVLENWQTVWNLTDVCLQQEGVFEEVVSGGVGRDGIPPLDAPLFDDQATADLWLQPQSPVISVQLGDIARAYPLAILTRHEIANDMIGEIPIAVTFCPLCNSAIVFDRRVEGHTLRFGVSGFLRNSDLIMWDDITQSWWQQLTGEGIVGTYTGTLLDIVPSQVVGYGAFKEQYPDGEVLSSQGRSYGTNGYVGYDSSAQPFLFTGVIDNRLFATARVLGVNLNSVAVAYPFDNLSEELVINDTVGETDVVALWQSGSVSALDAADIDSSKDVGMAGLFERALNDQTLTFSANGDAIVDDQTGSTWNIFGTAISGDLAGSQLQQINAFPHFWFAWAAFYSDTQLYGYEPPSTEITARYELDPVYGNPDAPVTLIEYGAYGCSACKFWHEEGFIDDIIEEFDGQVNLIFRDLPIVSPQYDQMVAELAQCALDQSNDLFWVFHDAMYTVARQGVSTANDIVEMGRQVGLDADALRSCYEADTHVETVRFDLNRGTELGARGTPTFFVGNQPIFSANPDTLRDLLQAQLDAIGG
jgi:protein-disulfide isomerase